MRDRPEISVVIPCLNEAENVANIAEAVALQLQDIVASYEILFIDNGSTDSTVEQISEICSNDARVRLIVNNKNYGQMRSPTHAIYQTTGRGVIGICADFQDPPELIPAFIERWRNGASIVLGVKRSEESALPVRLLRSIGYAFFARFGNYRVIPGATGFGIYDRAVVDCLKQWRDPEPFFRGMLVESGFPLETIMYDRPARARGVSKNNIGSLLNFAVSGLASCSSGLLRLPIYISLIIFGLTGLYTIISTILTLLNEHNWPLLVLIIPLIISGLIFLFLGMIGEQVRLVSGMVRNAPLVIESRRINFPSANYQDPARGH